MNSHFTSVLHATSRAEMAAMVIFHLARNYYVEKVPEVLVCLSIHLFYNKNRDEQKIRHYYLPPFRMLGDSLGRLVS